AFRTMCRKLERSLASRMILVVDDFYDLGDYIAAALHQHPIADLHSESIDLVLVMQRGALDGCSADRHWTQSRERCEFAGSPNLYQDVYDLRGSRTRRVLIGDGPTRSFAGKAQLPP